MGGTGHSLAKLCRLDTFKVNSSRCACWAVDTDKADQNTAELGNGLWHVECDLQGKQSLSWCWGEWEVPTTHSWAHLNMQCQLWNQTPFYWEILYFFYSLFVQGEKRCIAFRDKGYISVYRRKMYEHSNICSISSIQSSQTSFITAPSEEADLAAITNSYFVCTSLRPFC